jgi:putative iron-dependent peroxidase
VPRCARDCRLAESARLCVMWCPTDACSRDLPWGRRRVVVGGETGHGTLPRSSTRQASDGIIWGCPMTGSRHFDHRLTTPQGAEVAEPQPVVGPLTSSVVVLVLTVGPGADRCGRVRGLCRDLADLVDAVEADDKHARLSCVIGFGAQAWPKLFGLAAPEELHPFTPVRGHRYDAPATPGDVFLHIRADRNDLCFELAAQILARLDGAVTAVDEIQGFRYFSDRNLLGFAHAERTESSAVAVGALVGDDSPEFAGGSFAVVQKYLHDLKAWNGLGVHEQEQIMGCTKHANLELGASITPSSAHRQLAAFPTDGQRSRMVRDHVPFGSPAVEEFGTYFIGYAGTPTVIETVVRNMYVGCPPGNYDRLLDFSSAVTGSMFFCPSRPMLRRLAASAPASMSASDVGRAPSSSMDSLDGAGINRTMRT